MCRDPDTEDLISRFPVDVCAVGATAPCGTSVLTNVTRIDNGFSYSCAIVASGSDGDVVCWGYNDDGRLGDNTTADQPIPVDVLFDTDRDGCSDDQENGTNENLGGLRDPRDFWDWYDTPNVDNFRDRVVLLVDLQRVAARFGDSGDKTIDPVSEPAATPAYHPAFDRADVSAGNEEWEPEPADGFINIPDDILGVAAQIGHSCFLS